MENEKECNQLLLANQIVILQALEFIVEMVEDKNPRLGTTEVGRGIRRLLQKRKQETEDFIL